MDGWMAGKNSTSRINMNFKISLHVWWKAWKNDNDNDNDQDRSKIGWKNIIVYVYVYVSSVSIIQARIEHLLA